jgi:RNA-directed DNA polymerase
MRVEQRGTGLRQRVRATWPDTERIVTMTTKFIRFTEKARAEPQLRFNALMGLLFDPEGLHASFGRQNGKKAPGVDGIRKVDYAEGLESRLTELSCSLRQMGYRPQPVRRVYIPKGNGRRRPLGIPCFEDRIVQDRLSLILQAIWEPEFQDCSFGFRPGRSAHDALRRVAEIITNERTQWVVEADIKGFFDHVSHAHLLRFVEHRIADPNLLRILRRFLKAGVMEEGVVSEVTEGTPQGGLVSPALANIYLHYVLDLWFERRYKKSCRGKAFLVRYCDDFIVCFQHEDEAHRFHRELGERLSAFDLEVEPSKTAVLRFGTQAKRDCHRDGLGRPQTFSFLGLTHYVGRSRRGRFVVGRKTERKRFNGKLKQLNERLCRLRMAGGKAMMDYVRRHLEGHIRYYGVSGNYRALSRYVNAASRLLFKWLNRRSQRRSIPWKRFRPLLLERVLPRIRIIHNLYPVPIGMTQTGSRMV